MKKEGYAEMTVITTECYELSLLAYPSVGEQHCNGATAGTIDTLTHGTENDSGKP